VKHDGLSVSNETGSAASRLIANSEDLEGPYRVPASSLLVHSQTSDYEFPGVLTGAAAALPAPAPAYCPPGDCDEAFQLYREWIGWTRDTKTRPARVGNTTRKTVVINDLHVPDQDDDSIRQLIANEAEDTDELVIAGDFATMFAWSRFPKFSQTHTAKEEIINATKVLRLLAESFRKVKLFGGNHDARFVKWLVNDLHMDPQMLDVLEYMNPGFCSPLNFMAKGLSNVEIVAPVKYEGAEFGFLYQFGDMVVTHAETYSKIPNRATTNVAHWLRSFALPIGIVKPFRCVGQAHTHQAGVVFSDHATWCFELGCMCNLEDYVGSAKIMTPRPFCKGYTRVIQDSQTGRTDINLSRFVHTGTF
jgi:hypothetical protein